MCASIDMNVNDVARSWKGKSWLGRRAGKFGCIACSAEQLAACRAGQFSNFEVTVLKYSNLKRHQATRQHRQAVARFLKLTNEVVGAPSVAEFAEAWSEPIALKS